MEIDFGQIKKIHFVGIKGVAMTALAIYAQERGVQITGSDTGEMFPTDSVLKKAKIMPWEGFSPGHLAQKPPANLVIYTGAHGGYDNIEVQTAREQHIPTLAHGQALGIAMAGHRQISVAGSHGKTTTAAMIATILTTSGKDASYTVGCGEIFGLGPSGHFGHGNLFVAEADEYVTDPLHDATPRFLWQTPEVLVTTNIDYDHPDVFSSLAAVQQAFGQLQQKQVGAKVTIVNADDPASRMLLTAPGGNVLTYGFSPRANLRITHVGFGQTRTFFTLSQEGMTVAEFSLKVPGKHNALNATAAACACRSLGLSWEEIRHGLLVFGGTKRRFEKLGSVAGIIFYDDYAHHPREIQATLTAARAWYPNRRIISLFQPHTYSRTRALLSEFARAFGESDVVLFSDIYASTRETDSLGLTGATLVEEAAKFHSKVHYTKGATEVASFLGRNATSGDIILFMGAGDIYAWGRQLAIDFIHSHSDG